MSDSQATLTGIAWYRMDRYADVLRLMSDGASFPKSHASWRQKAGRMEREMRRHGQHPVRIEIDPDVFGAWCRRHGLAPDSVARARYVAEAAAALPAPAVPPGSGAPPAGKG